MNNYNITINFTQNFEIKAESGETLNKKIYNGSFSLEELKNKSKFFKMYDSIEDTYNDIKLLLVQNSFYIQTYEKSIAFCIKKQIVIPYDIIFPLKENFMDIKEIVTELYEKNINLEKKVDELESKINEINMKFEKKIGDLEKVIENIVSNKKYNENRVKIELNENNNINDDLTNDERDKIKSLFDKAIKPKKFNLLYNGFDREEFFKKCNGKDNLLFLINDKEGKKYGGYMSSRFIKNEKFKCVNIRDEKSFLFNLDTLKKFMVIKPEKAIEIRDGYFICFGGDMENGNDLYINNGKYVGRNKMDSYGDVKYEITNGCQFPRIIELKIYQLFF